MLALMDMYSDEEFYDIVMSSYSYKECLQKLGYFSNSGDNTNRLKNKIAMQNIDVSHFIRAAHITRNEENIFTINSTADQSVLRRWYISGQYSDYICAICGQEPFWNGKKMSLILDHINGVNNDDRLENLRWVCPNCNQQLDTTNGKNKKIYEKNTNRCVDCGKPIFKQSIRCLECNIKYRNNEAPPKQVSREELKNLIRTTSFTQIGRRYDVSDNAVRKWCEKYKLPKRSSEIKMISDDDWVKI